VTPESSGVRRRALLAGLGAVAAGCTSGYRAARDGDRTPGGPTDASTLQNCATPTATPTAAAPPADAEFRLADLAVEYTTDSPDHRYVLEPSAFYSAEAVEREAAEPGPDPVVMAVEELDSPDVRAAVTTAIRAEAWRADELPDGLAETVERVDFFTGASSGTSTHVGLRLYRLHPDRPPAVVPEVRVTDPYVAPDDPGEIAFGLRNRGSEPREVFSGTVPPFGMLHAEAAPGRGRFLLWADYESEGCFSRTDEGWLRCDIGKVTRIEPCERVTRRYEVLPSTTAHYPDLTVPRPGRYEVAASVSHSTEFGAPSTSLSFTTTFDISQP
jgi:hypothetical protein